MHQNKKDLEKIMNNVRVILIGNEIKKIAEELTDFNCVFVNDEDTYNVPTDNSILTIVLSYINTADRQNRIIETAKSAGENSSLVVTIGVIPKNDFSNHFIPNVSMLEREMNPLILLSKSTLNEYETDSENDGIYYLSEITRGIADIIDYQKKGEGIDVDVVKDTLGHKGAVYVGFFSGDNGAILENILIKALDNNDLKENLNLCKDVIVSIACPVNLGFRASKSLEIIYKFFDESVNILFDVRPSDKENSIKVTILGVRRAK